MQQAALEHARRHGVVSLLLIVAVIGVAWAALAPIRSASREHLLEIPAGALQRRLAGDITGALPLQVRLTVGIRDVLHLKNSDSAPHYFGPVALAPGKQLRLPFEFASEKQFASSAHFGGKATVLVEPWPDPGWPRLRWRIKESVQAIRHY